MSYEDFEIFGKGTQHLHSILVAGTGGRAVKENRFGVIDQDGELRRLLDVSSIQGTYVVTSITRLCIVFGRHTSDNTTFTGLNPLQNPCFPISTTSYGIQGFLYAALATE